MDMWSRLKKGSQKSDGMGELETWMRDDDSLEKAQKEQKAKRKDGALDFENEPMGPQSKRSKLPIFIKWSFFLLIIIYSLLSYYRIPILNHLGQYLVVQHPLKKADLIVCMTGFPAERGMAAAEIYKTDLAAQIWVSKEPAHDSLKKLQRRGIDYPDNRDLLIRVLQGLGVPKAACLLSEETVETMVDEIKAVKEICLAEGYRTLIVVTSPFQARRTWLTYQKLLGEDFDIMIMPTPYSRFGPNRWWENKRYKEEVMIEYLKLFSHVLGFL
jgi:uncharacterized SAM-binding protein YcdF (DUF218 family)